MAKQKDTTQLDLFIDGVFWKTETRQPRKRKPVSDATRQKIRENRLGKKWSEEAKHKMSVSHLGLRTGEKNNNWKGGDVELLCKGCQQPFKVRRYRLGQAKYCSKACRRNDPDKRSSLHKRIRGSIEYRAWRTAVFERDDFTCQDCGRRGKGLTLQADHIKPFALFPELRFDLSNGRTLCIDCHSKTDTFGVHTWRRKAYLLSRAAPETKEDLHEETV